MLTRALKMAFWVLYDHLGKLLLAGMIWGILVVTPAAFGISALLSGDPGVRLFMGIPATLFCILVPLPVVSIGMLHMARELIDTRDGSVRALFTGMRLYAWRAVRLGALGSLIITALIFSAWFYAVQLSGAVPLLGYGLSILALWVAVFVALTVPFAFAALVQKREGVVASAKLGALLVLDNPILAVGLAIQLAALTLVSVAAPPVMFFLFGSMAAVLISSAYEMLSRKYERIRGERNDTLKEEAETDDYLNRGFRDFLFPWKG